MGVVTVDSPESVSALERESQEPPARTTLMRRIGPDVLVALLLFALHVIAVWGYIGVFWGDIGRWSHEVERLALGELPYRDFQWHYPPMGLWVEGSLAALIGTERAQLSLITATLAAVTVVASVRYARSVLGRIDIPLVIIGVVFALSYAQSNGAPLPLGLYSPAALVGAMFIALAAMCFVQSLSDESRGERAEAWSAIFAALAFLSKQDFWLPALFIVGVITLRSRRILPAVIFSGVTAAGVTAVVATAGSQILWPLLGGFGHAKLAGGQGFPSWERLTVEVFVIALLFAAAILFTSFARRKLLMKPLVAAIVIAALTGALHIVVSMNTVLPEQGSMLTLVQDKLARPLRAGESLVRPAFVLLGERAAHTPIPFLLPPLLLALVALRWSKLPEKRRTTIAVLLALAVAARTRRAFEGTEWFEFLLTMPIVVASAELLLGLTPQEQRRFRTATIAVLSVLALAAHYAQGRGVGTRRYFPVVASTPRGDIHLRAGEAIGYRRMRAALDSLDPQRERPLYAYGFSGGFNYFMKRRNPFPFTQDFYFSAFNADSVLARRPSRVILMDNLVLDNMSFGAATFDWRRWEQPRVAAPYGFYDRPRFDRLKAGCRLVPSQAVLFRIYDCP